MLTAEGCRKRIARLWAVLPESVDWVLISDPRHVTYFSAFSVNPLSWSYGERALLFLQRDGNTVLLGDNATLSSNTADYFVDDLVSENWYDHRHGVINRDHVLFQALSQLQKKLTRQRGMIEKEWLPLSAYEMIWGKSTGFKFQQPSLGSLIRTLRRQKEADEIELLERCMRAGEAGQARARESVRAGIDELAVYREVQAAVVQYLGSPALVYGDFRAITPGVPGRGGPPGDYVLRSDDAFILDFSVMLSGYRSDITNTLAVGEASPGLRELFRLCTVALERGENSLRAGAASRDIYAAVAAPFVDMGRPELFPHHAGHGLGLGHPEPPVLVPEGDDILLPGDVVTLEPGAYDRPVGGVRLEHNYLITEQGCRRLSNHDLALS